MKKVIHVLWIGMAIVLWICSAISLFETGPIGYGVLITLGAILATERTTGRKFE